MMETISLGSHCDHIYQVTLYGLPEELVGGDHDGGDEEDGGGALVEQAECPVINAWLSFSQEQLACPTGCC